MSGAGIGELIWLTLAVLLGLGVVITWIIKAEMNRSFLLGEIKRLRSQLGGAENEKSVMMEEMQSLKDSSGSYAPAQGPADGASGNLMIGEMIKRTEDMEKDNARLKRELNEARSSLEEVYKAMCSK